MIEIVASIFLIFGSIFMFLSALGILRFPDVFTRMHAATKAASFGSGLMLISVMLYIGGAGVIISALLTIVFIFMTAPVASHMIGRAAYFRGVRLWDKTVVDELKDRYDIEKHTLSSKKEAR
ncbi:MAG: monovalent cation/H(+) antiporter subunit G [candidate division KSB1 bacterium]|jgi:multicomponent Na+:H+ antiporter subunit G|nr:monovalent cation/H(+) antiporter subunit G [candidate division KSB1 bacterium]